MRFSRRFHIGSSASLFLAMCLLPLPAALFAEGEAGFYDGRVTLELRGSPLSSIQGGLTDAVDAENASRLPLLSLTFGTSEQQLTALGLYATAPQASLSAVGGEFVFEYGVTDWLGIGFDIHQSVYTVKNVTGVGAVTESFLPLLLFNRSSASSASSAFSSLVLLELLFLAQPITVDALRISTLDFNATFHFLDRSAFDPYFKILVGAGPESELSLTAVRAGAALGARVYAGSTFFVSIEANYSYYSVTGKSEETGGASFADSFTETAGYVGLGVSF
jgi:hypothetical protein